MRLNRVRLEPNHNHKSMQSENRKSQFRQSVPDWLIENIADASKNTRQLYLVYLGFLAYCIITAYGITDRQFAFNDSINLPILGLSVPLRQFFIYSPIIAFLLFLYIQVYLFRLQGLILDLRTNYASVTPRRLYPWIFNIFEDPEPGAIGIFQRHVAHFILWFSLPVMMGNLAMAYLKAHDPIYSYRLGASPLIATVIVDWFYRKCSVFTYRRDFEQMKGRKGRFVTFVLTKGLSYYLLFMLLFVAYTLFYLIPITNKGLNRYCNLNLDFQILVRESDQVYEATYWGDFREAHLEGASMFDTILKKANFTNAYLDNAILIGANIAGATFLRANLKNTHFQFAKLETTTFHNADLDGADFYKADLRNADFSGANLTNVNFEEADLRWSDWSFNDKEEAETIDTKLDNASFKGADLRYARGLTLKHLSKVRTLYNALIDSVLLSEIEEFHPELRLRPKFSE